MVAHEVGHEYVWEQWQDASRKRDAKRLRELELICDAISVLTIMRLGVPATHLVSGLRRMDTHNSSPMFREILLDTYPSLSERAANVASVTAKRRWTAVTRDNLPF